MADFLNHTQRCLGYLCARNSQNICSVAKVRWQNQMPFYMDMVYFYYAV